MKYIHEDYVFEYDYNHGKLYKGDHLVFKGNGWSGIQFFLTLTNHAPEVQKLFHGQLTQREIMKEKVKVKPIGTPKKT